MSPKEYSKIARQLARTADKTAKGDRAKRKRFWKTATRWILGRALSEAAFYRHATNAALEDTP